ncbi:MAG: hypothetical protein N3D84_00550, partial [Candidatus Woesearchaeota archaeon]|nr:hypothetical protein [Candidatus Woesearchaeota archaeon]
MPNEGGSGAGKAVAGITEELLKKEIKEKAEEGIKEESKKRSKLKEGEELGEKEAKAEEEVEKETREKTTKAEEKEAETKEKEAKSMSKIASDLGKVLPSLFSRKPKPSKPLTGGMASIAALTSKKSTSAINTLFLAAILIHFIDFFTGFGLSTKGITGLRFGLYVSLMFFAWFTVFGGTKGNLKTLYGPATISTIAFFLPLILSEILAIFTNASMNTAIGTALVMAPVWPVYMMFTMAETKLIQWCRVAYI